MGALSEVAGISEMKDVFFEEEKLKKTVDFVAGFIQETWKMVCSKHHLKGLENSRMIPISISENHIKLIPVEEVSNQIRLFPCWQTCLLALIVAYLVFVGVLCVSVLQPESLQLDSNEVANPGEPEAQRVRAIHCRYSWDEDGLAKQAN